MAYERRSDVSVRTTDGRTRSRHTWNPNGIPRDDQSSTPGAPALLMTRLRELFERLLTFCRTAESDPRLLDALAACDRAGEREERWYGGKDGRDVA